MAAKATKVYPIKGRYLNDVPAAVQLIATKKDADRLVHSGAFTDNPQHPERDHDAPDSSGEPVEPAQTSFPGEQPSETPAEAGPSEPEEA